jgi:Acyclic terpene utilisation family protein AtuA
MAAFAHAYPSDPVDVIISDYMSEANMVVAAARKIESSPNTSSDTNPLVVTGPAFEASFLEALEPALPDLARYGIRVVVNAGASDTEKLYKVVREMIHKKGLASQLKLAWISGDEVLPAVKSSLESGSSSFKNIYTGETLSSWNFDPI